MPESSPLEFTPFRADVIAGFRAPTNVAELTELIRLVLDVATPLPSCPDGPDRVEVTLPSGRIAHVVVLPEPTAGGKKVFALTPAEARLIEARRALHARLEGGA